MSNHIHRAITEKIRCAAQLWSCDPDDCPLCDCNIDDEQRKQLHDIAESEAREIMKMIGEKSMSIRRYRVYDEDEILQFENGEYVLYADHVAALEAFQRHEGCDDAGHAEGYMAGQDAERARIRQSVEALGTLLNVGKYDGGYDCCGCSTLDQLYEDVLLIINGDLVGQSAAPELNNEQPSLYNGEWHCDLYGHDYDDAVICRVCNHDGCEMGSQ